MHELRGHELWRAVFAELIATLLFVFMGTMSAVDMEPSGMVGTGIHVLEPNNTISLVHVQLSDGSAKVVKIAFTFGLMIAVCIQMFGHVSGGHMNPAVSIAMAVGLHVSPTRALLYVLAQCAGGILGSLILKGVTPVRLHDNLGLTSIHRDIDPFQAVVCEAIFTFILVMSIFGCTDSNRTMFGSPAIGIGFTVTVVHLAAIPFTGASMNPARSIASSIISNSFDNHWVFWVGPILGAIIASIAYKYLFNPYRTCMTYDEATQKMMQSEDVLLVPKKMFADLKKSGGKTTFQVDPIHCCSHL